MLPDIVIAASAVVTTALFAGYVLLLRRMPALMLASLQEAKRLDREAADAVEAKRRAHQDALDKNPFYRPGLSWNLTRQGQLLVEDYATAALLASEAGVVVPPQPPLIPETLPWYLANQYRRDGRDADEPSRDNVPPEYFPCFRV